MRRPVSMFVLALVLAGGLPAQPPERGPQWVEDDTFHDADYAFAITRPSSSWRFLEEERVGELLPDACMGAIDSRRTLFFGVIAERAPGVTDLDAYDRLLHGGLPTEPIERARETVRIDGRPAIRTEFDAEVGEGMAFVFVRVVVLDRGFGYQLVSWTSRDRYERHRERMLALLDGFRFADSAPRTRDFLATVPDQATSEWRIADGRYENASFSFALSPPEGWRLMGAEELAQMNADASLGLAETREGLYQLHVVEPLAGRDPRAYVAGTVEDFVSGMGLPADRRSVTILGAAFDELTWSELPGGEFAGRMAYTVFHHEGFGHQIHTFGTCEDAARLRACLDSTYAALTLLGPQERARAERACAAADSDNAVGATWSLRGGVYRDFAAGWTYTRPDPTWRLVAGEAVALHGVEDALLYLEDPRRGIYVFVFAETLEEPVDLESRHRDVFFEEVAVQRLDVHGRVGFATFLDLEEGPRDLTVTTGAGDLVVVVQAVYEPGSVGDEDLLARQLLEAFARPEPREASHVAGRHWFECRRLGFRLELPAGRSLDASGKLPFEGMESISRILESSGRGESHSLVAICTASYDVELGLQGLLDEGPLRVDPDSVVRDTDRFHGERVTRQRWEGRRLLNRRRATTWVLRRGNTFYLYVVTLPADTAWDDPAWERAKTYLTLLP